MAAAAGRDAEAALDWLCELCLPVFEGSHEPAWLDGLEAQAGDIDDALIRVLDHVPADRAAQLGAVAVSLVRWWRTTGQIADGCEWLLRLTRCCPDVPELLAWTAHLLFSAGRLDEALTAAAAAGDSELALVVRAHIGVVRADYATADTLLQRALTSTSDEVVFEATVVLAQAATRRQRFSELAALATRAQRLAWESGLDRQLAQALLLSHTAHRLQGRAGQAAAAAQEALQVATAARARTLMAVALGALGGLRVEAGDLDGARSALQRSLDLTVHGGDVRTTLVTTNNLGETERLAGNAPAARQHFAAALRSAKRLGDDRAIGFMLTALAELALAEGDPAAAADPLREAVTLRASVGDSRGLILSLEGAVLWAVAAGAPAEAARLLGATDAARARLDMARDQQLVGPLEEAMATTSLPPEQIAENRRRGTSLGLESATELATTLLGGGPLRAAAGQVAPATPPERRPLAQLQLLGGFSLAVGGEPVDPRSWQSRKARDLLKILAVARGLPVTRESVMEWLWPGSDPAVLPARLSVALSTLRSVLGKAREAVVADRDTLALDLALIEVDLVHFHRLVTRADYLRAVDCYTGELLPGDVFAEWPTLAREAAASAFVSVAHTAAEKAAAGNNHGDTALLCRRILAIDAYDERAHRRLIDTLSRSGAHGEARKAREDYAAKMDEIGVTPRESDS